MGLNDYYKKRIKKLDVLDYSIIKSSSFLFGLAIGAYFGGYLAVYWWVLILLAIALYIRPITRAFGKY